MNYGPLIMTGLMGLVAGWTANLILGHRADLSLAWCRVYLGHTPALSCNGIRNWGMRNWISCSSATRCWSSLRLP